MWCGLRDLSSWPLKERFTGIFTAGRVAKLAFDRAGIPAHVVYHNHGNNVRSLPLTFRECFNFNLIIYLSPHADGYLGNETKSCILITSTSKSSVDHVRRATELHMM